MKLFSRAAVTDPKLNISLIHSIGLLLIFGAALAMRFYPLVASPEEIRTGFGPFGDSFLYHKIAYNLYRGNGYSGIDDGSAFGVAEPDLKTVYEPAITRGPVYPFFIALIYRIWGDPTAMESINRWHVNWNRVRVVQSVLDALICLLLFFVMRVLYPEHNLPAFLAAGLYAFSFYNIFYTRMLLSEAVTTFFVTVAILAALMALKSGRRVYWLVSGAGFGLTNLSRLEYILFPVCLAGFLLLRQRYQLKKAINAIVLLGAGVVLVMTPWTLRNYLTFNQFIPASVGAIGFNLFNGTYENGDWAGWGRFPERIFKTPQMKKEVTDLSAKAVYHVRSGTIGLQQYDRRFRELALDTIKENPFACLMVWVKRLPRLWYQNYIQMYYYREPSGIWFIGYFILALFGFFLMEPAERMWWTPIVLLFVYLNLIYLPLHIEPRYGLTAYPGGIGLASVGLWKIAAEVGKRMRYWRTHSR